MGDSYIFFVDSIGGSMLILDFSWICLNGVFMGFFLGT